MFIYLTTNKINNKKYIGLCSRIDENYLGSGKLLKAAIKKYGKENFTREILYETNDREELSRKEKEFIEKYNAVVSNDFYNICDGGYGRNSEAVKTIWDNRTKEEREIIDNRISEKCKEQKRWSGNNNPFFGKSTSKTVKTIWDNRTKEEREIIGKKVSKARKESGIAKGKNNPMYGRSIITEKNMKWYTNGEENRYFPEGKQPPEYWRGRTNISGKIGKKKNDK
jgi:group I intron endonuclease